MHRSGGRITGAERVRPAEFRPSSLCGAACRGLSVFDDGPPGPPDPRPRLLILLLYCRSVPCYGAVWLVCRTSRMRTAQFLPGVTDNVAHTARELIEDLLKIKIDAEKGVFTSTSYFFSGKLSREEMIRIAEEMHNPLIQRMTLLSKKDFGAEGFGQPAILGGRARVHA